MTERNTGKLRQAAAWALAMCLAGCGDSATGPEVRKPLLDLRFTEIHYHPLGDSLDTLVDDEDFEFLELKNIGESDVDLTDVGFSDGIEYDFPSGTTLKAGAYLVLAAQDSAFTARYGSAPDGAYKGKLDNAGERVALRDLKAGADFLSVTYSDDSPWPTPADGGGQSLVPRDEEAATYDNPASWRISTHIHGSPRKQDSAAVGMR